MSSVPSWVPSAYVSDISVSSAKWGVPPELLAAVLKVESGFNPNAVSSAGAEGIAQFEPGTAQDYGVDPWDPTSAIDGSAHLLSDLHTEFGSWFIALAAYNGGPGAIQSDGTPSQATAAYATDVLNVAGDTASGSAVTTTAAVTDYSKMDLTQLENAAANISPNDAKAGAAIYKALHDAFRKQGGSENDFTGLALEIQKNQVKVTTPSTYGWHGDTASFQQFIAALKQSSGAVDQHKGLAGAVNKGVSSLQDLLNLVNDFIKFFTNAAMRKRILIGALGVGVVLGGFYFVSGGFSQGGGGTKVVPIPV